MGSDTGHMHATGAVLDEEQHVQATQKHRIEANHDASNSTCG